LFYIIEEFDFENIQNWRFDMSEADGGGFPSPECHNKKSDASSNDKVQSFAIGTALMTAGAGLFTTAQEMKLMETDTSQLVGEIILTSALVIAVERTKNPKFCMRGVAVAGLIGSSSLVYNSAASLPESPSASVNDLPPIEQQKPVVPLQTGASVYNGVVIPAGLTV
jgi:hypothetical protein